MPNVNKKPDLPPTSDGGRKSPKADEKVTEGAEGMRRLEGLVRRILRVPKDRVR
jgi:hypothetical protein